MIDKLNYKECTLCQACISSCPKQCIELNNNKDGFLYPLINRDKCIKCDLCEKKCPVLSPLEENISLKKSYAAKNLNEDIRFNSSSGGMFTAIAESIIEDNGFVSGVAFDKEFKVKHQMVNKKKDLGLFRGSKYVQSDINNIFIIIEKYLKLEKKVMFSGTPCQIAGLKSYLDKEYNNLYTVDFICHGIPSQKVFDEYIKLLEKKYKSKIVSFRFREKSKGWHSSSIKVMFENGKCYTKIITEDMYYRGFLGNVY